MSEAFATSNGSTEDPSGSELICNFETLQNVTSNTTHTSDLSVTAMQYSFGINGLMFATLVFVHQALVLCSPRLRRFFAPRMSTPVSIFAYVVKAYREFGKVDGLTPDEAVMIRFLEFGFRLFGGWSLFSLVLCPLYDIGGANAKGMNQFNLTNLPDDTYFFFVVLVCAYLMVISFAYNVRVEWRHFIEMRRKHLIHTAKGKKGIGAAQAARSIMVTRVPVFAQEARHVRIFFDDLFGYRCVHSCIMHGRTNALRRLSCLQPFERLHNFIFNRPALMDPTEVDHDANWRSFSKSAELRSVIIEPHGPGRPSSSARVDSSPFHLEDSPRHCSSPRGSPRSASSPGSPRGDMSTVVQRAMVRSSQPSSTAFVTFRSLADREIALQIVLSQRYPNSWYIDEAVQPESIIWGNIEQSVLETRLRRGFIAVGLVLLVGLWGVPVVAIFAFCNVSVMEEFQLTKPLALELQRLAPFLFTFLQTYMPVLALMWLLVIIPHVLYVLGSRVEQLKTWNEVERSVLARNLVFNLATLYVVITSSSVWQSYAVLLKSTECAITLLRNKIPASGVYFVTFVFARIGITLPMYLMHPWDIPRSVLSNWIPTPRRPRPCFFFAVEAVQAALIFMIGLTYALIFPFILPACALYFGAAMVCYRWFFDNVYLHDWDGGGEYWYDLFHSIMFGLLFGVASFCAIGLFYLNLAAALVFFLPLILIVVGTHWRCYTHFGSLARSLAFEDATKIDKEFSSIDQFDPKFYQDPVVEEVELTS